MTRNLFKCLICQKEMNFDDIHKHLKRHGATSEDIKMKGHILFKKYFIRVRDTQKK